MHVPTPPSAATPEVHPDIAEARLLALMTARHLRSHLAFHQFMARALKPVEVSE